MLNFPVRDLDKMAAQLQAAGIAVKMDPQSYPNGRFARVPDPQGNPIELWQPNVPDTNPDYSRIQKHGRPRYGTNLLSRQDLKPKTRPSLDRTYHNRLSPFSRYF
jgi:hypothetical protein